MIVCVVCDYTIPTALSASSYIKNDIEVAFGNGKLYALTSNSTNHNTHLYVKCLKLVTLRLGVGFSRLFTIGPKVAGAFTSF